MPCFISTFAAKIASTQNLRDIPRCLRAIATAFTPPISRRAVEHTNDRVKPNNVRLPNDLDMSLAAITLYAPHGIIDAFSINSLNACATQSKAHPLTSEQDIQNLNREPSLAPLVTSSLPFISRPEAFQRESRRIAQGETLGNRSV
jgi:hypothetical protein